MISPFWIIMPSSKMGFKDFGLGERWILIPWGITILRIHLLVHSGFCLTIAGIGIASSHSGTHRKIFWTWFQSKNVLHKVNFRIPQRVSWTIPLTGLLACDTVGISKSTGIQTCLSRYPWDLTQLSMGLFTLWYAKPNMSDNKIHGMRLHTVCSSLHHQSRHYTEVSQKGWGGRLEILISSSE